MRGAFELPGLFQGAQIKNNYLCGKLCVPAFVQEMWLELVLELRECVTTRATTEG